MRIVGGFWKHVKLGWSQRIGLTKPEVTGSRENNKKLS